MCAVSMIYDHYGDKWKQPPYVPWPPTYTPAIYPPQSPITPQEIEEFRKLLERAREYDKKNNQKDCELDSKREALKKLAKDLGVDLVDI